MLRGLGSDNFRDISPNCDADRDDKCVRFIKKSILSLN
jgi:hypothetical protein